MTWLEVAYALRKCPCLKCCAINMKLKLFLQYLQPSSEHITLNNHEVHNIVLALIFSPFQVMLANSSGHPACHCEERSALLQFKESFIISRSASKFPFAYPKVESSKLDGNGSDCCLWDGVECDEDTGHVIELDSTLVVSMVPLTPTVVSSA